MDLPTPPPPSGPRWLYLHGYGSGPESFKGVTLAAHYGRQGVHLERLNLRLPSFEQLRLSAGIQAVRDAIGGPQDRAIVFGSSLGGLTAMRVAQEDPRVCALVLLAPAFFIAEQLRRRFGEAGMRRWESAGVIEAEDFAEKRKTTVDYGFIRDVEAIDARLGGWPDVRVPTLVVHGRADDTALIDYSRAWAKGKRHVRLVEVDDGHELTASVERVAQEADAFLRPFLGSP
jgi:hypothetical protein